MNKNIKSFAVIILAFLFGGCRQSYAPITTQTCDLNLQIFVQQGISAGQTVSGVVEFGSNTSSTQKSELVDEKGASLPVSFSFSGQSVQFIIETEDGEIYATGIMENNLYWCSGIGGGTLSGPLIGDLGDWRGEWHATEIPIPTANPDEVSVETSSSGFSLPVFLFFVFSPIILLGLLIAFFIFQSRSNATKD